MRRPLALIFMVGLTAPLVGVRPARAADEEEPVPLIKIVDWSMDRARKDISGATNLVRALMKIRNIGESRIEDLRAKLVFFEAMGGKLGATKPFRLREIKPGATQPLIVSAIFVPIFGSYELHIEYKHDGGKYAHKYMGSSPFTPPELITKRALPDTAKVVVLGHDIQYDARRRMAGVAVRLKNLGELQANDCKLYMRFYDAKRKVIGKLERVLDAAGEGTKPGIMKGGEERIIKFIIPRIGKYAAFDIHSANSEPPTSKRLAGKPFKNAAEIEVAHYSFESPTPAILKVGAKVRNGLPHPVVATVVTFVFYAEKEVTLRDEKRREYKEKKMMPIKKVPISIDDRMETGDVAEITFEVTGVTHFANLGYEVEYQEPGEERKPMSGKDVGEVLVDKVNCVRKGETVEISAVIINARKLAAKDIVITFSLIGTDLEGNDATMKSVSYKLPGLTRPGEKKPITVIVTDPPVFKSYFFEVKYDEGGAVK